MKNLPLILLAMLFSSLASVSHAQIQAPIIPVPVSLKMGHGFFEIDQKTTIRFNASDAKLQKAASFLAEQINP